MSENSFMVENCASLPVDILKSVISYKLGEPEYLKIKHNHIETLKRIQKGYKINRTKREIDQGILPSLIGSDIMKRNYIEYFISRNIPLSIKSIKDIVFNEYDTLDCLFDGLVDDESNKVKLIVEAELFVRFHHFNYYDDDRFINISYRFLSCDVVDNVTKDNIKDVLRAAHQEINSRIDEFRNRMSFKGVKSLRLKLIVDKLL